MPSNMQGQSDCGSSIYSAPRCDLVLCGPSVRLYEPDRHVVTSHHWNHRIQYPPEVAASPRSLPCQRQSTRQERHQRFCLSLLQINLPLAPSSVWTQAHPRSEPGTETVCLSRHGYSCTALSMTALYRTQVFIASMLCAWQTFSRERGAH
jgi:hypothetical protein